MATRKRKPPVKFVVTARYTMKSRPVTTLQKEALVSRVRKSGGTATVRKVTRPMKPK